MKSTLKNFVFNFYDTIGALLVALKHPQVPLWSKFIIVVAIAYALSPVDIIPDFIPFVGYLDDTVILPLLFFIAIKSIPQPIFDECKIKAQKTLKKGFALVIVGLLLVLLVWTFIIGIIYAIVVLLLRLINV